MRSGTLRSSSMLGCATVLPAVSRFQYLAPIAAEFREFRRVVVKKFSIGTRSEGWKAFSVFELAFSEV